MANFYTNIEDLQPVLAKGMKFYAFYYLLEGNKAVSVGAMRGLGKLKPTSLLVFISYYVISPPL